MKVCLKYHIELELSTLYNVFHWEYLKFSLMLKFAHFESRTENYWMPFLYRLILLNGWVLEHKFLLNN